MPEHGHVRNIFDGREVPRNDDGALPHAKRQVLVVGKLDQKSASPE
jgi:hypothetical protein